MGLVIKSKEGSQLVITNTTITIAEVYARITYTALASGRHVQINSVSIFQSKEKFNEQLSGSKNMTVSTNFTLKSNTPNGLILEVENQEWATVGLALQNAIEEVGYDCEIEE